MTVVTEDRDLPGGVTPFGREVGARIVLAGENGDPVVGYGPSGETIAGTLGLSLDDQGRWSRDLVGNLNITPSGTVYRLERRVDGRWSDAVFLSVPATGGPYGVSTILTDAPGTITSSALAVQTARIDTLEAARPSRHDWYQASDWDAFTVVPVSDIDNTVVLTADAGRGVATGSVSGGGLDRRIYELDGLAGVADVEMRLDWEITIGNTQVGIAMRSTPAEAVIVWNNILFGANGNLLQGVWEYDGDTLFDTNGSDSLDGFVMDVISASGDGAEVTVRTRVPHLLTAGVIVHFDASIGGFGQFFVASVVDAR